MENIKYVGVNDHIVDLFEGIYKVKNGMSYNSYVIVDEKIAIMDTVDSKFCDEWLLNIKNVLGDKEPNFLIVQHMEPDHSSNIKKFLDIYKNTVVVSSNVAFNIMKNYFESNFSDRRLVVKEGDTLSLGKHVLQFVEAPMVHWPEVIMTYDKTEKVLFSADAFRFGKVVFATTTYNAELFPFMRDYLVHLIERQWKNRMVGIIGNGSWVPTVDRTIMKMLETCANIRYAENNVKIFASMKDENKKQIEMLAKELMA